MNTYVGIDIGKFFHVASAITEKGEEIQSFQFPNPKEGFLWIGDWEHFQYTWKHNYHINYTNKYYFVNLKNEIVKIIL